MWTIIKKYFTTLHTLLLNLPWRLYRGQSKKFFTRNSQKMKSRCFRPATPGFWNFAKFQSCEIQVNPQNPMKFGRNLTKYLLVQHIWDLSRLMGLFCHKLANLSETLSLQQENVPKLSGVLRLLLQKAGLWPVHDIKSFAIGAFLNPLLLK